MEKAKKYDEMIENANHEYKTGMRHLATMMGVEPESFTQADADVSKIRFYCFINQVNYQEKLSLIHFQAAIEYLFPSGLYEKRARPIMKPAEEIYPPRKRPQFDFTGRPIHYQFYTCFANYYDVCHVS